jgi:hypothetical protein
MCYKKFDPNYMGEEKSVNAANSYGVDSNWYADLGATDHVTGELDKLTVKDNYNGSDHIYTANRSGMYIKHIGQSIIRTPYCDLKQNNVLHVPQAHKKILHLFIVLPLMSFIYLKHKKSCIYSSYCLWQRCFLRTSPLCIHYEGSGVEENSYAWQS